MTELVFDNEARCECDDDRALAVQELAQTWENIQAAKLRFDNEIGWHEVLDRSCLVQETWEQYVLKHPCVVMDQELHAIAWGINELMLDFYQAVGRKMP